MNPNPELYPTFYTAAVPSTLAVRFGGYCPKPVAQTPGSILELLLLKGFTCCLQSHTLHCHCHEAEVLIVPHIPVAVAVL